LDEKKREFMEEAADPQARETLKQNIHFQREARQFNRWQRVQLWAISKLLTGIIRAIGLSLRWEVHGEEHLQTLYQGGHRAILTFWHGSILPVTYYFRNHEVVPMVSQNFDGEWVARTLENFGLTTVRGSNSRGGLKALLEMVYYLGKQKDVAFAVDGPRGPRYQAKMGPVMLARRTGHPILCCQVSSSRYWRLNSWDHTQIPCPFSRAVMRFAPPLYVPRSASHNEMNHYLAKVQQALDALQERDDAD
jgi:lysophospholipid acyltransferase (LPLAT)-like uncharacterized protein